MLLNYLILCIAIALPHSCYHASWGEIITQITSNGNLRQHPLFAGLPTSDGMESKMTPWDEKVRVTLEGFSLELPVSLAKQPGSPIDSLARGFEGSGLSVIVDQGPFSDRLTSYVGRPDYQEEVEEIAGVPARMVFFRTPAEGTYTVAAHMPDLNGLTVVVRAAEAVPQRVARDIVKSVKPVD